MTDKEFIPWLKGFLTGKLELNMKDMAFLKDAVDEVIPTQQIQHIPNYPMPKSPIEPVHMQPYQPPFNTPTCVTGKQLLNDGVIGPGNDNYGRDKKPFKGEF